MEYFTFAIICSCGVLSTGFFIAILMNVYKLNIPHPILFSGILSLFLSSLLAYILIEKF